MNVLTRDIHVGLFLYVYYKHISDNRANLAGILHQQRLDFASDTWKLCTTKSCRLSETNLGKNGNHISHLPSCKLVDSAIERISVCGAS